MSLLKGIWHWIDFYLRRPFENATDFTSIWASTMNFWPHNDGYRIYKAATIFCYVPAMPTPLKWSIEIDRNRFSLTKLENCHLCHSKNAKPWIKKFSPNVRICHPVVSGHWHHGVTWSAIKLCIHLKTRFCVFLPDYTFSTSRITRSVIYHIFHYSVPTLR